MTAHPGQRIIDLPSPGAVGPELDALIGVTERLPSGRGGRALDVLSFNLQHLESPGRFAVLADHLRDDLSRLPDFILFQEVMFKAPDRGGVRPNSAASIAELLPYECRATKRVGDREGVAILSRYPFVHFDELRLKSQTSRLLLGFNRVSIMGEFIVPQIGLVRVVNVHLTNWGFERRVRRNQLNETLRWIASRDSEVPADVTVLGGDFNCQPGDSELRELVDPDAAGHLRYADHNSMQPTRGSPGRPRHRVDYIFVALDGRSVAAAGEARLWPEGFPSDDGRRRYWLSDHVPVLHRYVLGRPASAAAPLLEGRGGE